MSFFRKCSKVRLTSCTFGRRYESRCTNSKKGIVLGVYNEDNDSLKLSPSAEAYNNISNGKLIESIKLSGNSVKEGKNLIFWGLDDEYQSVAVVGLGKQNKGHDDIENIDQDREAVRVAASVGIKALQNVGVNDISVENFGDAEAAAEGSVLASWKFQELKTKKETLPTVRLYGESDECNKNLWEIGCVKAKAQNLARRLADMPSNLMTPTIFAKNVEEALGGLGVKIAVHDEAWAKAQKMFSFLSVSRGSIEPPKFIELSYGNATNTRPFVLIGKGVTFDSGGISIKPSASMDEMRADMTGAACVIGAVQAVASLKLNANLKVLVPLTENMPSGSATKPGDVVTAMNGKTICVDNTDAEGRLILADALCYSEKFNPAWVLDIATLTGAMRVALGNSATGVFTNSNKLYNLIENAGTTTGDRVWRFPLWKHFTKQVTDYPAFDVNNVGKGKGGGSCTAAAFLQEFVPKNTDWLHLDIAGVMGPNDSLPYLSKGMTGRPTRTLIEFIGIQSKET